MSYQVCSKLVKGVYEVGSSSGSKNYKVNFDNCPPTCTCVAFAIARNRAGGKNHGGAAICKHINSIYDSACDFDSRKHGESMLPICPHCGAKLETVDATSTPTSAPESLAGPSSSTSPSEVTSVASGVASGGNTGSLLTKLSTKLVAFTGVVIDAGGGEVRIVVDGDTTDYPPIGCKVRVVEAHD